MKNKNITTIEITDTHVKVMQATASKGGSNVIFYHAGNIKPQADDEISKILLSIFKSSKLRPDNLTAVVPRRFAIMRSISLPSHQESEIEKMVDLQVVKQVPYPKEDIVLDYKVLEKEQTGYSKILVVAVHKEVISRYLNIFKNASLNVNKLTLSSDGLINWHNFYAKKAKPKASGSTLFINIDSASSEICFCQNTDLFFSRSINFGSKDLSGEQIIAFVEQVELTVSTYTKEGIGKEISHVIIASSFPKASLLKEKLNGYYAQKENIQIDVVDPIKEIRYKKGSGTSSLADNKGESITVCYGLCLPASNKLTNLLSTEFIDTRKTRQTRRELIKFFAVFAVAFFLGLGVFMAKIYKYESYLKEIQEEIGKTQPKVTAVKEKIKRLNFIKAKLNPEISINDIIYELYDFTPVEISFKSVHLSSDGSLDIQGISEKEESVNLLQRNLVNSELFEEVTLQYATKRRVFKGEMTDFKIVCKVAGKI